jgi:hypothetical protein
MSFHSSANIWSRRRLFLRSEHIVSQALRLQPCPPHIQHPNTHTTPALPNTHTASYGLPKFLLFLASYLKGKGIGEKVNLKGHKVTLQIFISLNTFGIIRKLGYTIITASMFRYSDVP